MIKQIFIYINPINWFYWVSSKLRKYYTDIDVYNFYFYISKRAARCPQCVINKKCIDCSCEVPEIFLEKKDCKNWKNELE